MGKKFKTVDLFAGPGGLAEGFASFEIDDGSRPFSIELSVEKEGSAFATLRLRAFFRQFREAPSAYYRYIAGDRSLLDELKQSYPTQWAAAVHETVQLELGSPAAQAFLDQRLDAIAVETEHSILIGGPPCQAYSLVGRARNKGIASYVASEDSRHFLYKEYIRILGRLQPAAFIMENVKGILSAKVDDDPIFSRVVSDLQRAGGSNDSYHILPLIDGSDDARAGNIIRSEQFGIPQARHRVILLGIRSDRLPQAGISPVRHKLQALGRPITVGAAIGQMPALRSGLSSADDSPEAWKKAVVDAFMIAARACRADGSAMGEVADRLRQHARTIEASDHVPPRESKELASIAENELASWIVREGVIRMPNHETRGHMKADLARYAFAATFAQIRGKSPKADEFPVGLAPEHRNWTSGKFADRFRVQLSGQPSTTITSHISKDGHYFIHPDPLQCRSLTVREAARLQTFPDDYFFEGNRTQQYVQVGNAVPPLLARQIAEVVYRLLTDD